MIMSPEARDSGQELCPGTRIGSAGTVAAKLGVSTDDVNLALSRLLRLRLLKVSSSGAWSDATGLSTFTEASFRKLALARVREQATALGA